VPRPRPGRDEANAIEHGWERTIHGAGAEGALGTGDARIPDLASG